MRSVGGKLVAAARLWMRVGVLRNAAALAYYSAFSIAPLLVVALGIAASVSDAGLLEQHLLARIHSLIGPSVSRWLGEVIAQARDGGGGLAAGVAGAMAVVGATTALAELRSGLDDVFGRDGDDRAAWWSFVRTRALALGLILALALLLVVSLVSNATLSVLVSWGSTWLGADAGSALVGEAAVLAGTCVLFAAVYAWLPSRRIRGWALVVATLTSAALFTVGRWILTTWIATGEAMSAFGASASLAVFLLWVYYSAAAFYTGAVVAAAGFPPAAGDGAASRERPGSRAFDPPSA